MLSISGKHALLHWNTHLSFLAREDEVKCLHFLMIIMDSFLGQHNPSNYFALTVELFCAYTEKDMVEKKPAGH